jgi:hypothetical protein
MIEQLVVDPRRVVLTVNGDTESALAVFLDIQAFFAEVEMRQFRTNYDRVSVTHDTVSTTEMGFEFRELFAGSPLPALQDTLTERLPRYGADLDLYPTAVRFQIGYRNQPVDLARNKITLLDKYLSVEIKDETDPADRVFSASSPSDSGTHLSLLETLEDIVVGSE